MSAGGVSGRVRGALGMPLVGVIGLAALGVPRVVAHDLGPVGGVLNALLVFAPIAVWLMVVLWRRVPNPFLTLVAVGLAYGVLLGVAHQILWPWAFETPPRLGGNLAGALPGPVEQVVLRAAALLSSVATGVGVGILVGAVAWTAARLVPGLAQRTGPGEERSGHVGVDGGH